MNSGIMACLPPSPNWYKPFATAGCDAGFYCYAAKNTVVVLDARHGTPVQRACLAVGSEVVTSVMFCRCERADADDVPALLTVSVDGKVQVWDVKDGAVKHTTLSQSSACCADWRGSLSTSVVFTGKSSTLLLWNIVTGSVAPVERPVDQEITILRSHPTDPDIVAIGYYNGFVIVQGLMKRGSNMIYKLKGHNGIVLSLSWNTNFSPKDDGTQHKQLCLCSTAFDRTLKIWNVSEEKFTKSLKAPLSNKNKKFDTREKWTAACWIPGSGEAIVSSSATGDVCIYEPGATKEWTFLDCDADSGGHSSAVYNICLVGGTQGGTKLYAVSASEDRNIIFWDLAARKSAYCIPSLGGFVYSLAFSPFACATLAVGVGDGSIKVWRTDCIANPYSAKVFTVGKKDRVLTVAWHPKRENTLAFGTAEGRVCVADVNTRVVTVSHTHHTGATYVVCWAELTVGEEGTLKSCLLSCGSNRVRIHQLPKLDGVAPDIETVLFGPTTSKAKRVSVAFNLSIGILTLSNADGLVELYKSYGGPLLKKVAVLEAQRKPVECLAWHPSKAPFSDANSYLMYWLACSSTDGKIYAYDLSRLETPSPNVHRILQPTLQFSGQSSKVVSLAWSPFQDSLLASAAYDQTVQVWDVEKAQLIATYQGHSGRVFSVCWSPADSDIIFSGGEDCFVRCWKLSEQPVKPLKASKSADKAKTDDKGKADDKAKTDATSFPSEEGFADSAGTKKDTSNVNTQNACAVPAKPSGKAPSAGGLKKKSKTVKSYFPCFSQFENQPKESRSGDVQYLTDILAKQEGGPIELNPEHSHLGMFTTTSGALSVLDTEIRYHKREHNLDYAFQMMAWKGDTAVALREAAAERRLTDTLVALAPSVSRALWYEMCERYAAQLLSDGEHHRAVLYYLACRKVKEALKLLCDNSLHREALSIARAHLSDDDPEIHQIYASWAERAVGVGNFELAAKCYLAIGDPSKAVASLMNRKDPYSLRSAAYVAKKNGLLAEMEMSFQAALQCSLIHNEWEQTAHFVEEQGRSRAFLSFVQLHKALVESVNEISQQKKDAAEDQDSTTKVLWSSQDDVAASFLSSVVSAFESNGYSPLKSTLGFTELSEMLGYGKHASKTVLLHDTKDHVLFHIAGCLVVALFSPDQWKLFFARALSAAYQHDRKLFNNLCRLLFRGKVADSAFAGELTIDINPGHCLLFDRLEATADSMAASFECPPSSRDLWANFNSLSTNAEAQADPGREVLLLYLCETLLDACCESESAGTRVPFVQSISSLMFSPTIACLEHLSHKLTSAERNLLTWRSELSVKKASGEESNTTEDELARSVLEEEVELCKRQLQEMKAAAFDCPFPPLTQVFRRLVQLLESTEDKSCTELKAQLEAWVQLVLDV
ncbi:gem-associated protein 5-like [Amblyomma americanum]